MTASKATVVIVTENSDADSLLAGALWLKGMVTYKANNSDDCLNIINELNSKVDAVVMSDEIAADRSATLIINIKNNRYTKILVIAGEESAKTRILDYGADEFSLKPLSSENIADKVFSLLVNTQ